MAVKLNKAGFEHAESLIKNGLEVDCAANDWSETKPDADDELKYLESHSLDEYGLWFLGLDTEIAPTNQTKFLYPIGDFNLVQESALMAAVDEAKKNGHHDIAEAADKLLSKIAHCKS